MTQKNYLYGLHATLSLLKNTPDRVTRLHVLESRDEKIKPIIIEAKKLNIPIEFHNRSQLDKMVPANHQGIIAECMPQKVFSENDIATLIEKSATPPLVLVLDGVQDPHNLGACFRTADAAGVTVLIAPKDKSASITPVVAKVASGALDTVPFVQVTNLVRALENLKKLGLWIYGADEAGIHTLYQIDFKIPVALVLGAEGSGLRRLTREHCDDLIRIPMLGSVDSLNISVAAGVCLYEVVRQRWSQGK